MSPPGGLREGQRLGVPAPSGSYCPRSSLRVVFQGKPPWEKSYKGRFGYWGRVSKVCVRSDRSLLACGGRPAPHLRRIMTMLVKEVSGA